MPRWLPAVAGSSPVRTRPSTSRASPTTGWPTLQYTGGTTGVSKGAVLTEGNLLANIAQCIEVWKPGVIEGKETVVTALPLYHIFAFTANLMVFFAFGGRNILIPSPRPLANLKQALTAEGATWLTGVNTLFAGLMHEPWFKAHTGFTLKGTVAGGMALVPVVGERWETMTKTPMYQGYGLTETSPVVTLVPFHRNKRESIGVPVPGTDIRIVDDDGKDVVSGQPGELLVRGPQVMRGYWQRPDETARVLRDGWLSTGDIASADDEGYVYIVDRKKDMILVSGFNVYPNEVEAVLAAHPAVAEVAVIGRPDETSGEIVCAFVVRTDPAVYRAGAARPLPAVALRLQSAEGRPLPRHAAEVTGRQGAAQGPARPGRRIAAAVDNLCHALTGLAMGHAGLKRRTPLALTTLVLAANAPDIDIAVVATDTLAVYFRRGWTHGPPAMLLLPVALTALVVAFDRFVRQRRSLPPPPVVPRQVLVVAALGTWSHPLLDYMNSYGIRLLMPFSGHWFYGDALYIIDPWLYLVLGAGVWLAWKARGPAANGIRTARAALVVATLYVAAMYGSNLWARSVVAEGLARAGQPDARFMVTPVAVNPFEREVLVDLGDRYEKGFVTFAPLPRFRPAGYGVERGASHPAAVVAAQTPLGRQYLTWSRFPFFVVEEAADGTVVHLNDARYSGASGTEGWAALRLPVPAVPR